MAEEKRFDAKLYYKSSNLEWIVLIHGFGGSAKTWKKQIDFFSKHYNLLVLEMHKNREKETLDLDKICTLINNTLGHYRIEKAHFISFSFSTLICMRFATFYPEKVDSLIMGGGIIKFNLKTRFLIFLAITFKRTVNYMLLYRFFAYVIMPRKNHKISRTIFVQEAKKLGHDEFCKWIDVIPDTKKSVTWLDKLNENNIRVLYILGDEDHLFSKSTIKYSKQIENSQVEIVNNSGHVCSIEQHEMFNLIILSYLNSVSI